MYQFTSVQSMVNQAANHGSYYYVNPTGLNYDESTGLSKYWRLTDEESGKKVNNIKDSITNNFSRSILKSDRSINLNTSYKALIKQLNVNIEERYMLPFGNLLKVFGLSPYLSINVYAVSPLDDNAEFIRNMDTVADIKNCILNGDNKWIGDGSKVNEVISKILKKN